MVLLSKSDKRKLLVKNAAAAAGIVYRAPHKNSKTRWNDKEATLRNFINMLQGLNLLKPDDMFDTRAAKNHWVNTLNAATAGAVLLTYFAPFMKLVAQWVQVMSSNLHPSVSLVRVACKTLKTHLNALDSQGDELLRSDRELGESIKAGVLSLSDNFDLYLGGPYRNSWYFIVAEALDVKLFKKLSLEEKRDAFGLLKSNMFDQNDLNVHLEPRSDHDELLARMIY